MSAELTRKSPPARRGPTHRNTMAFPRELRAAIPDLHHGRVLELDSIDGQATKVPFFGPLVQLKLTVRETGKVTGTYTVRMDLQPAAAREFAATLAHLAEELG